ncbi:MAG: long-chain-fatty-acid--CoA ligase [Alphaproteobacteria bacterium]|nr:long-chain-fatty-acid--CoA ligase [Alphaproteobacteria bacterium]
MLLSDIPVLAAHHAPDVPAILFEDRVTTYRALRDRVFQLSHALADIAAPGDRIAILAENCPEYIECYYAVPGARMGLTLLNYRLSPRELAFIIGDSAPKALFLEPKYLPAIREVRDRIPSVETLILIGGQAEADCIAYEALLARGAPVEPSERPAETDLCWLLYTSGTTGLPKGAMLSHRNLLAAIMNALAAWETPADDVCLQTFPLFHVAGYVVPIHHLRGVPLAVMRNFDPETLARMVERHKVTNTAMAPTMVAMLLDDPRLAAFDLSSLRRIGYGASAMPAEIIRRAQRRWPAVRFTTGFGMTELAGNVMAMGPDDHERAAAHDLPILRSVGKQMPLARVRVVDDAGQDAPPGETGELVVKGDQVLCGYWGNPDATKKSFIDGWFRSGDLARWDDEGYLYIVDRKKDMILTGGENVYPREVEEVLFEHPEIADAAVIGSPDVTWGEIVVAVVCQRSGAALTAEEVIAFVRERIASYKKPRCVVFLDALPRNASGKVLKRELRERIASGDIPL